MPHYIVETADRVSPWDDDHDWKLNRGDFALVIIQAPTANDALSVAREEVPNLLKEETQATAASKWLCNRGRYWTVRTFLSWGLDLERGLLPNDFSWVREPIRPIPTLRELVEAQNKDEETPATTHFGEPLQSPKA